MDQLQKAGGPATSVGIDQNRPRVRLFLLLLFGLTPPRRLARAIAAAVR
jgi:hypothetical protein